MAPPHPRDRLHRTVCRQHVGRGHRLTNRQLRVTIYITSPHVSSEKIKTTKIKISVDKPAENFVVFAPGGKKMDYKQLRKEAGLTQADVAYAVGISLVGYRLIECGVTQSPRTETLEKLKELLKNE